jgi:hypothetical protein
LKRYDEFLEKKFNENRYIIYLTLDGREASEQSSEGVKYKTLSYKDDILKWLELCKKESVDNPILRETLTQYILLIRQLTEQTRSIEMEKDIIAVIMDKDNSDKYVSAVFDIAGSFEAMKKHIVEEKILLPLGKVAEEKGFTAFLKPDLHGKGSYFRPWEVDFWIYKEKWEYLAIGLKFIGTGKGLIYGLLSKEEKELKESRLSNKLKIVEETQKEAKGFEEREHPWFLLFRYEKSSLWKNWANTKEFFTEELSKSSHKK